MPPRIRKLTSREMLEEIKKNSQLARDSLNCYGLPKPIQSISEHDLLRNAILNGCEEIVAILIAKGCSIDGGHSYPGTYHRGAGLPLHIAVERNNLNIARTILLAAAVSGNNILNRFNNNESPLYCAVRNMNADMIDLLIEHGADWKVCTNSGKSVLHLAVENIKQNVSFGMIKKVLEIFLKKNMNVDTKTNEGQTPLHYALRLQMKELVEFFLTHNANLHALDNLGNSALHILVSNETNFHHYHSYNSGDFFEKEKKDREKAEFADWLISIGADIDLQNHKRETPLHLAIKSKQKRVILTLLNHSENFDSIEIQENQTVLHSLLDTYQNNSQELKKCFEIILGKEDDVVKQKISNAINSLNKKGDTPVHLALRYKHIKLTMALLPFFTNINIHDSNNQSLLFIALNNCFDKKNTEPEIYNEIVEQLISRGVNINEKNKNNETPLQLSAKFKNKKIAILLIDNGADATVCSDDGKNLLHFLGLEEVDVDKAIQRDMVNLFIEKGCDPNAKTNDEQTPLCLAIKSKSDGVSETLFELYTSTKNVNIEDLSLVLRSAAEYHCEGLIQSLIKHGVDINMRFLGGKTALHIATQHKSNKIIKTLLANSADYEICDDSGKIPLHDACWYESEESIDNLLEYGSDINKKDKFCRVPKDYISGVDIDIGKKLLHYVTKLKVADLFINDENEKLIELNKHNEELNTFYASCLEEIQKLKNHVVCNNISLYDVLHMDKYQLSVYRIKSLLNKILCSVNLKEEFPVYRDLILASHRKGVFRSNLLNSALYSLIEITETNIPDNCLLNILEFFTNEELRALIDYEFSDSRKRKIHQNLMKCHQSHYQKKQRCK